MGLDGIQPQLVRKLAAVIAKLVLTEVVARLDYTTLKGFSPTSATLCFDYIEPLLKVNATVYTTPVPEVSLLEECVKKGVTGMIRLLLTRT